MKFGQATLLRDIARQVEEYALFNVEWELL
jgi:hypothetical protein